MYHDTLYTSSYTGDLNTNAKILDEGVKEVYDQIQEREELTFIKRENGMMMYFDNQKDAINAERIIFTERSISTRSGNSSGRGEYLPDGSIVKIETKGNYVWTVTTKVDPNNSNRYYVKVTGNDATKRRVAKGDGAYIYPRNNKDRPAAKIGTEVPPFSAYVEVYEFFYSLTYDKGTVKSIIPDYLAGGMMYKKTSQDVLYAELDTEVLSVERKVPLRKTGTYNTVLDYTIKTYTYNFMKGGGTRFTGFYPFIKEDATIAYWIEYVPISSSRPSDGRPLGRN